MNKTSTISTFYEHEETDQPLPMVGKMLKFGDIISDNSEMCPVLPLLKISAIVINHARLA
jgi:hypothetical protein